MRKSFIITLTGPSACGKGLITEEIINYSYDLQRKGIEFYPFMFKKDVTRSYRIEEAISIVTGSQNKIDVNSVSRIPETDDLVYRTYGDEYALNAADLDAALSANKSPIVVINDVRVVEELKHIYPGRVLSLFVFRHIIPDLEQHEKANAARGGVASSKILSRYEKAVALYRVFIENIHIFDRVILNVKEDDKELARIQARGVIDGIFNGKISLDKKIIKGPKLFIVSGNAASGKDDIIKAAKQYGKQQTDILIKSTSRQEEDGDVGEIICKYIPKKSRIEKYQNDYNEEVTSFERNFNYEQFLSDNFEILQKEYAQYDAAHSNSIEFETFVRARFMMKKMEDLKSIPTAAQRFWHNLKLEQDARRGTENQLSKDDYLWILENYFELNKAPDYIDLETIRSNTIEQQIREEQRIEDKSENKSWHLIYHDSSYIFYENNELYGEPIKYGFEIGRYVQEWKSGKRNRHLVLTASLPNMFRICREEFGTANVITAFTYSQISQAEHEAHSDRIIGHAKSKEYNDIIRYANHIADFDYALIYAETSLTNLSGNQKDELVDQMFRLFRVYNNF